MDPISAPHRSRDELRLEFGAVVREHRAPLINFLRRYTGEEHAAADLAQEALVKAYFQIDRFDDRRPFAPWLFTVAANCGRDYLRKRAREFPMADEDGEAAADIETPDRALAAREREEALEAAITALPAGLREPILLHYQLDWPVEEIARHLNIEAGAVKTRLHRARRRLQELLSAEVSHHE